MEIKTDQSMPDNIDASLDREWLLTNGLGGWAAGSLCGATTRSYHGLLVAARHPPEERYVFLCKIEEDLTTADGINYPLGTNEWGNRGNFAPKGYRYQKEFVHDGSSVTMTYQPTPSLVLHKKIFMAYGRNSVYISYTLEQAIGPLKLTLRPFLNCRDFHSETSSNGTPLRITPLPEPELPGTGCSVALTTGEVPLYHLLVLSPGVTWTSLPEGPSWYKGLYHRAEAERGLPHLNDVYVPGAFVATLSVGQTITLATTSDPLAWLERDPTLVLQNQRDRLSSLLSTAAFPPEDEFATILLIAADQFIVTRSEISTSTATFAPKSTPNSTPREMPGPSTPLTVIAGYHWFGDWGRDTMISLPGLTLVTGRYQEAAGILRTFARYVDGGMLPNRFPDNSGPPAYNTVDATLWYFHALDRYYKYTGDVALVAELYPILQNIVTLHEEGTRYHIKVDSLDNLLYAGEPGVQLTWMDAKIGDWVVTPRQGKAVEINALWFNALGMIADFATLLGKEKDSENYRGKMNSTGESFRRRFWNARRKYLFDVIDTPAGQDDDTLRPNQLIAASLPRVALEPAKMREIVNVCASELLIPFGLRTLAVGDPAYKGIFTGDQLSRDAAYHQGTVWPWLIGPFCDAHYRVYGDRQYIADLLKPFLTQLQEKGCLGSLNEVYPGNPPFDSKGCVAQAWSVAEVLRIYGEIVTH